MKFEKFELTITNTNVAVGSVAVVAFTRTVRKETARDPLKEHASTRNLHPVSQVFGANVTRLPKFGVEAESLMLTNSSTDPVTRNKLVCDVCCSLMESAGPWPSIERLFFKLNELLPVG